MNKVAQIIRERTENTDKKITCREISNELGIPASTIRAEINTARFYNIPICSCRSGYYYSNEISDLQRTIASMQHRIYKQNRAIDGLKGICKG